MLPVEERDDQHDRTSRGFDQLAEAERLSVMNVTGRFFSTGPQTSSPCAKSSTSTWRARRAASVTYTATRIFSVCESNAITPSDCAESSHPDSLELRGEERTVDSAHLVARLDFLRAQYVAFEKRRLVDERLESGHRFSSYVIQTVTIEVVETLRAFTSWPVIAVQCVMIVRRSASGPPPVTRV